MDLATLARALRALALALSTFAIGACRPGVFDDLVGDAAAAEDAGPRGSKLDDILSRPAGHAGDAQAGAMDGGSSDSGTPRTPDAGPDATAGGQAGAAGAAGVANAAGPKVLVVLVDGEPVGVAVDRLIDRMDVMMRPMAGLLAGAPGLVGTTILGDGAVLIVLDIAELIR
ncbi:MAG: chemotaxis protein CheW [Microvirga sp.]